ncbi:unnamed protein product, partial [Staurois parvus]
MDCRHSTGEDQRLRTQYRRRPETADTVQEKTRDCGHSTGDGPETADTDRRRTRDCGHST